MSLRIFLTRILHRSHLYRRIYQLHLQRYYWPLASFFISMTCFFQMLELFVVLQNTCCDGSKFIDASYFFQQHYNRAAKSLRLHHRFYTLSTHALYVSHIHTSRSHLAASVMSPSVLSLWRATDRLVSQGVSSSVLISISALA